MSIPNILNEFYELIAVDLLIDIYYFLVKYI